MDFLTLSRILYALLIINEIVILSRSSAEERSRILYPRFMPLPLILILLPFVIAIELPDWLGLIIVILQGIGLALEIVSEIQLLRAKSFSVNTDDATIPQVNRMYRWLENPIYIGILIHIIGWAAWMPVAYIAVILQYDAFRRSVREERKHLAMLGTTNRGIDSVIWN